MNRIRDVDGLFRYCLFPTSFSRRRFVEAKFLKLYDQEDGSLLASVAWERYVPSLKLVHEYGCRISSRINERLRAASKFNSKTRNVYCGAYRLVANRIRALGDTEGLDEVLSADVVHHPEDGEIAHTDLRIVLETGEYDREATKTAIVDRLWNECTGPIKHACECDLDVQEHPSIELPVPPRGTYLDQRSLINRFWQIAQFHICQWWLSRKTKK